jgi:RIO-like serine/threonine protein kinase
VIKFIPNTPNVNKDRTYFVDGDTFLKYDNDIERGIRESSILQYLTSVGCNCSPKFLESKIAGNTHLLIMEKINGETLENLKHLDSLTKRDIYSKLLAACSEIALHGIAHGDINESNIMYDISSRSLRLIDFEMSKRVAGNSEFLVDIVGPPWGFLSVYSRFLK